MPIARRRAIAIADVPAGIAQTESSRLPREGLRPAERSHTEARSFRMSAMGASDAEPGRRRSGPATPRSSTMFTNTLPASARAGKSQSTRASATPKTGPLRGQ